LITDISRNPSKVKDLTHTELQQTKRLGMPPFEGARRVPETTLSGAPQNPRTKRISHLDLYQWITLAYTASNKAKRSPLAGESGESPAIFFVEELP